MILFKSLWIGLPKNKILFLDVDGSNNVQVDQKGTGNHFFDRLNDPRNFPDISIDELEEFIENIS